MPRCQGLCKNGNRCTRLIRRGTHCFSHKIVVPQPQQPQVPQQPQQPQEPQQLPFSIFLDTQSVHRSWVVQNIRNNMKVIKDTVGKSPSREESLWLVANMSQYAFYNRRKHPEKTTLYKNLHIAAENFAHLMIEPWGGFTKDEMIEYCGYLYIGMAKLATVDGKKDWDIYWEICEELAKIMTSLDGSCTAGIMEQAMCIFIGRIDGITMKPPIYEIIGGRMNILFNEANKIHPEDEKERAQYYKTKAETILREYDIDKNFWSQWINIPI